MHSPYGCPRAGDFLDLPAPLTLEMRLFTSARSIETASRSMRSTVVPIGEGLIHLDGHGRSHRCDLRRMHGPIVAVAVGDGETPCSKVRPTSGRTKLAEPSTIGSCGLSGARAASDHPCPVLLSGSASKGDHEPEPSRPSFYTGRSARTVGLVDDRTRK